MQPSTEGNGPKSPRRRFLRRGVLLPAAIVVVGLAALGTFWALNVPSLNAVTPEDGSYVSTASPTIRLSGSGLGDLDDVQVRLDGRDVTAKVEESSDGLVLRTDGLSQGAHRVTVVAGSSNPFRRHLRRSCRFVVDTKTPALDLSKLQAKPVIGSADAVLTGTTEPSATVSIRTKAGTSDVTADADGKYELSLDLPEGTYAATFTVADRAGNRRQQRIELLVDTAAPQLTVEEVASTLDSDQVSLDVTATDSASTPTVTATASGGGVSVDGSGAQSTVELSDLPQGTVTLKVTATDKAGHRTTVKRSFVVDSTETFGEATLTSGAKGEDVVALQKRLISAGMLSGNTTGVYDQATVAAVRDLQTRYGLTSDGIVGSQVLTLLSGRRIVVDLSECRLYLYEGDSLVKSYSVATGQSKYPTPTGTYAIIEKIKDPTWVPPDSAWAKDAVAVGPGEDNPLGTRWMGLSASGIGIHGIPASENDTIGTHASHGCIRMRSANAVDLFARVDVGTPVIIHE